MAVITPHKKLGPCGPSEGRQNGGRKETETSVIGFCHQNERLDSSDALKLILLLEQELFSYSKLEH